MSQERREPREGLSRRQFLKGSGAAAAMSALNPAPTPSAAEERQAADAVVLGPGPVKIELRVNGTKMTTSVEPRVTLLDALRNYLDVTGCKRVCDRGSCGACTVMVDGKTVYACTMLALEARGKEIRTAESLYKDGQLDEIPAAFVAADAQQCGFCTPGFVVSMRAVFDKYPHPTPQQVEEGLAGNICRCGTYEQMRHAIAALCEKKKGG
jgi:xanthine dehydrogenase YagT iron-sulfur-binding subunit